MVYFTSRLMPIICHNQNIKNQTLIKTLKVLIVIAAIAHHNPFLLIFAFPFLAILLTLFWFTNTTKKAKIKWTLIPLGSIVLGYSILALIIWLCTF